VIILGFLFIADVIPSSYLKTTLQRLGIRIEHSNIEEKNKVQLLNRTQEISELFKKTFEKFSLAAVIGMFISLIDNGKQLVYSLDSFDKLGNLKNDSQPLGQVIRIGQKNSERLIFYLSYLIPIIYAIGKL